jgi:alcohol dehydrogenase class IV
MPYEFSTVGRIIVGAGSSADAPAALADLGRRPALVVSPRAAAGAAAGLVAAMRERWPAAPLTAVSGEPTLASIATLVAPLRDAGVDCLVAIGGGSVLDSAKAAAALLTNTGDLLEYLEVVGAGRALAQPALPVLAVPTTAGTGSEATRNAVIAAPGTKASIRHSSLVPRVAVVDAGLMLGLDAATTAAGGMDAITQLIEGYVARRASPITDGLALRGLQGAVAALRRTMLAPAELAARAVLAEAALLSGMVLANAGLGAVHALAGPLGGQIGVPHGVACAALLAPVTGMTITALRRIDGTATLARYAAVARACGATGDDDAAVAQLAPLLASLASELGVARLGQYGLEEHHLQPVAAAALRTSNAKNHPVALDGAQLCAALAAAR